MKKRTLLKALLLLYIALLLLYTGLRLAGIVFCGFLVQGCSNEIDVYDNTDLSNVSIEQEAEEFSRHMADNLRYVVTCMNKDGDDLYCTQL
jgi:hypothetical protein